MCPVRLCFPGSENQEAVAWLGRLIHVALTLLVTGTSEVKERIKVPNLGLCITKESAGDRDLKNSSKISCNSCTM